MRLRQLTRMHGARVKCEHEFIAARTLGSTGPWALYSAAGANWAWTGTEGTWDRAGGAVVDTRWVVGAGG